MDVDKDNGRWLNLTATIARQVCNGFESDSQSLLDSVIQSVHKELSIAHVGIVKSHEGRWQFLTAAGNNELPPTELLATSAAEESTQSSGDWLVAPLSIGGRSQYLLSIQKTDGCDPQFVQGCQRMLKSVGPVLLVAIRLAITIEVDSEASGSMATSASPKAPTSSDVDWIGDSESMRKLRATVERVAKTDLPVLILGENGSGKEVVCRMIHKLSARASKPFLAVNCAALTQSLLDSELFGHEAGAFTDAKEARAGKFELAADGTLFLDEIGELNSAGQSKLLRAIEEKVIVRVGGWQPITTDARIIAATNRDVPAMVREKQFREDLFYRLNTVLIEIPPLRDRAEDILPLAEHFLGRFSRQTGRKLTITANAKKQLMGHSWPGNIRELRNMMERLTFLIDSDEIDAPHVTRVLERSPSRDHVAPVETLSDATKNFQIHHIKQQIRGARGNMTEAAKRLGLQRSNLYRKMRQLGMSNNESE